jgi:hypothetical protein
MFGRRSDARFALNSSTEGVLSVLREVVVERFEGTDIVAISQEAGILEEKMLIEIPEQDVNIAVGVQVVESRPTVIDGTVRHRLRLRKLETAQS